HEVDRAADHRVVLAADVLVAVDLPVEHTAASLRRAVADLVFDRARAVVRVEDAERAVVEDVSMGVAVPDLLVTAGSLEREDLVETVLAADAPVARERPAAGPEEPVERPVAVDVDTAGHV